LFSIGSSPTQDISKGTLMNTSEANEILSEQIKVLRQQSYSQLMGYKDTKNIKCLEIIGKSGVKYQIEIESFWDDKPGKNLRVRVCIDDGGLRVLMPLSEDFIISPSGSFVGEP
jgi:hypothetical protein